MLIQVHVHVQSVDITDSQRASGHLTLGITKRVTVDGRRNNKQLVNM